MGLEAPLKSNVTSYICLVYNPICLSSDTPTTPTTLIYNLPSLLLVHLLFFPSRQYTFIKLMEGDHYNCLLSPFLPLKDSLLREQIPHKTTLPHYTLVYIFSTFLIPSSILQRCAEEWRWTLTYEIS